MFLKKIEEYRPKANLGHTAKVILALSSINHRQVKEHMLRVSLLAVETARRLGWDQKAAFLGGFFHDSGKIILPYELFDGHNITTKEYLEVKEHTIKGFEMLKDIHRFVALCAGLHHAVCESGCYGITYDDFPPEWGLETRKKVIEISLVISVCDFIDAFCHRKTEIKDGSNKNHHDLRGMLEEKYPHNHQIVGIALEVNK